MLSLDDYAYERLEDPTQQIRLLKVNATLDDDAVITGSMSVHTIPPRNGSLTARFRKHLHLPAYIAVSYVWGKGAAGKPTHEIIVDNKRFRIAANLHAALRTYRSLYTASFYFWIDAVCINQADDQEKSAQIPLMRDIYHLAVSVYIWLGEETPNTRRVWQYFKKLTNVYLDRKLDEASSKLIKHVAKNENQAQKKTSLMEVIGTQSERLVSKGVVKGAVGLLRGLQVGLDLYLNSLNDDVREHKSNEASIFYSIEEVRAWSPSKTQLKLVEGEDILEMARLLDQELFSNTQYFNRMWTLQEFCVANRGAATLLGLYFGDIASALHYIRRTHGVVIPHMDKIDRLLDLLTQFNTGQRLSLRMLLALSSDRQSEDPKDRIYALQGLMRDKPNPLLQPDYTKSVAEVYANTTRHLIYVDKSLDIICGQWIKGKLSELPSWVPDFRFFALEAGALLQADGKNTMFHASGDEQYAVPGDAFQHVPQHLSIKVTGIPLGAVSMLSDISVTDQVSQMNGFAHSESQWAAKLSQLHEGSPNMLMAIGVVSSLVSQYAEFYQSSDRTNFWSGRPDRLQRLRDTIAELNELHEEELNLFLKYFVTLPCGKTTQTARCKESEILGHLRRVCVLDQEGLELLEKLCSSIDIGTRGRRLLISEGREIGAAPEDTTEGDIIYVMIGCSVPVILRKSEQKDEFRLIGECYYHGFMDGEALILRDEGKVTAHELTLI